MNCLAGLKAILPKFFSKKLKTIRRKVEKSGCYTNSTSLQNETSSLVSSIFGNPEIIQSFSTLLKSSFKSKLTFMKILLGQES